MIIVRYDQGTVHDTGIVASVCPFPDMPEFSITVYADGSVDLNGSATLSPEGVRTLVSSLLVASMLEDFHGNSTITITCCTECSDLQRVWSEYTEESLVHNRSPWRILV